MDASSAPPKRRLGPLTATLIVVANMIGSGVFMTSGKLLADLPSPLAVLIAWLVGGLLALCGALSYGELASAMPRNGGEYHLLSRIYHPALGFLAGWISLVVGFSAPIALTSHIFGSYLAAIVPGVPPQASAISLIVLLSALHAAHVRGGGRVQNVFTVGKIALIVVFVVAGALSGARFELLWVGSAELGPALFSPAFAVGLILVFFSYSGWNGAVYLAGEVEEPQRTLPLALLAGTGIVVVLYTALNVIFLSAAPLAELQGVEEIGDVAARSLFGPQAGSLLSGLIAVALVSSVSAMVMAGPRVYEAVGQDYPRFSLLGRRSARGGPVVSVALQAAVALVLLVTFSFLTLLIFVGFTLSLSAGLAVAGVIVLRRNEPDLPRPYRTWGYPATPLLFIGLCLWMVVHTLIDKPLAALAGLGTVAAGLLLYACAGPANTGDRGSGPPAEPAPGPERNRPTER